MSKNKTRTKDKYRVVYNDNQRIELENEFRVNEYIQIPRKQEIAQKLQLSERQIKIWFQNRRAKKRKQQKRRQVSTNIKAEAVSPSVAASTPSLSSSSNDLAAQVAANQSHVAPINSYMGSATAPSCTKSSPTTAASLGSIKGSGMISPAANHHHHHHPHLQPQPQPQPAPPPAPQPPQQQQQQQHHHHHHNLHQHPLPDPYQEPPMIGTHESQRQHLTPNQQQQQQQHPHIYHHHPHHPHNAHHPLQQHQQQHGRPGQSHNYYELSYQDQCHQADYYDASATFTNQYQHQLPSQQLPNQPQQPQPQHYIPYHHQQPQPHSHHHAMVQSQMHSEDIYAA